jgi:hypothetical protein
MLHMVMDADLSRFKTIVLERPGQLWAGSSGARWKDFCHYVGFSWAADWQSHLEVQGADSKGYKITWINFHPNPTSCPLDILSYVQPPLHCMRWRRRLGSIGCLEDDSSEDDAAEQTDDEDAAEASKLAAADGDDEFRLMLESAVTEVTGASSGGVAVEPLPSAAAAAAAAPAELLQVLNVTEILKRNHVSHAEAKLVKQVVTVLEDMHHATNPVPGVRCFEMKSGNGSSITWMRVPRGHVPDGDAGWKQQQRRAKIIEYAMETTGAGVETLTRIIRTQRAIFTEAASRASIVSKQHLGVEATLQVMQSVNASWSGMRALKKLLGGISSW